MKPLITVISVNYNQSELTCIMIDSLKKCTYDNLEIIIVDNASPTDNPDIISDKHPDITLIKLRENLGFAGGNNEGIARASGEYILFLNNDTEVDPGFIEPLVDSFSKQENLGMASPKIIFYNTDDIIQYAGAVGISPYTGRGREIGNGEKDLGQYDRSGLTDLAHGAAMMIPMKVIKEVGLMPDIFFLYYEEHDWCEMIKRAGYKVMYVATSRIFHKESMSVGKNSPLKSYYMGRNRLIFMRRNVKGVKYLISLLFFILISLPKNIVFGLIKRETSLLKSYLQGVVWNFAHMNVRQNPTIGESSNGIYSIEGAYAHKPYNSN